MPFDKSEFTEELAAFEAKNDDAADGRKLTGLYLGVAVFVALWAGAVALFGLPGLVVPALVMVPVMMLILVRLTRG